MSAFQLSKWYLDCVTDSGNTHIAYIGDLHWGPVIFHFSSVLRSAGQRVIQEHSLREQSTPLVTDDGVSWNSRQFGLEGIWHSDSRPVREIVFENEIGSVEWHCLMPRARACIGSDCGFGYVERLTMTVVPWKIPIQQLRWGRLCNASDWIVWIDWLGEYSKRILYFNGEAVSAASIEEERIVFEDGSRLSMDRSLILRNGRLGTTALSSIPGVANTFPARLLQVNECKWRSRARLERPGSPPVEGWAIHELVSWPK